MDGGGRITGWLNELAFLPVDLHPAAPVDPWSGDRGVGDRYFSQEGVIRLAAQCGLAPEGDTPAQRLRWIQDRAEAGDGRALEAFFTLGRMLGQTLPWYRRLLGCENVLLFGPGRGRRRRRMPGKCLPGGACENRRGDGDFPAGGVLPPGGTGRRCGNAGSCRGINNKIYAGRRNGENPAARHYLIGKKSRPRACFFAVCSICVYVHLRVRDGKAIFRKPVADVAQGLAAHSALHGGLGPQTP